MTKYITKLISGDQMYYLKDTEAREALVDKTEKGVANGIATLDSSGKVPSSQLPSYVDDVLEGYSNNGLFYATLTPGEEGEPDTYSDLITPETGKIYVDKATNNTFRWSGSAYIMVGSSGGGGYTAGSGIDITNAEISVDNTVLRNTDVDSTIPSTSSSNIPTSDAVKLYVDAGLDDKVDKISGKGLSTNDYTTDEKNKLAGIAAGAEANVQSDWNATSGDAFIKNKPALGSAAFTDSSDYAASNHNHDARYASLVAATGPSIESGTDLDTLLTAGTYYTVSSAVTNSLVNCPYTGSNMKLVVMYDGSSEYGRQIVFGYLGNAIYVRPINNLVPGSWQRILYTNSSLDASKLTGTVPSECYTNTTYSAATQSAAGLMSKADKVKLDGIATGANAYSLPTASASVLGGVKVGTNLSISNGVLSATDTTYSNATEEAAGLMSAADKTTLNGLSILSPVVRANRNTGDTAQWTIFASIDYPSVSRYDDIVLLVQGLGYYYSGQNTGCWIVECRTKYNGGTNPNTIGMTVTELSPKGSAGTVQFGYYTDTTEGKTYFGVYTSTRHHYIETIKLGGQNIEHLNTRKVLTAKPAGWEPILITREYLEKGDVSVFSSTDSQGTITHTLNVGDVGYQINGGTITGIKMNGASKGTSGVVDLGTVITAHQDISGKQNKVAKLGSKTQPVYTSAAGTFAACNMYAGGTAVTLNGDSKAADEATFYAPTGEGSAGQVLLSNGGGAPTWGYSRVNKIVTRSSIKGAVTINANSGTLQILNLTGNITGMTVSNAQAGETIHVICHPGSTARSVAISDTDTYICPHGTDALVQIDANGACHLVFTYDGTKFFVDWY